MSGPKKTYRVYCLDASEQMVTAELIEAASDEDAIAQAQANGFGDKCEIWQARRLVAELRSELMAG